MSIIECTAGQFKGTRLKNLKTAIMLEYIITIDTKYSNVYNKKTTVSMYNCTVYMNKLCDHSSYNANEGPVCKVKLFRSIAGMWGGGGSVDRFSLCCHVQYNALQT